MPSLPSPILVPYQTDTATQAAQLLALTVRDYLRDFRQLTVSDLDELLAYFQQPTIYRLSGSLSLRFASRQLREQDKCWLSEAETIVFTGKGYGIRIHQREDFYGDGYITNENRIDDLMTHSEQLSAGPTSFERLMDIMEEKAGHLTITTQRFAITKRRVFAKPE